jgi:Flp pilus assembly protein TadG
MLVGLLMTGLVFDGGAAMTTKASALTVAQQAARAGADQLDLTTLRTTGEVQLDPAAAEQVAAGWLEQAGVAGTVSATTELVTVTVTATGSAVLLPVVGITSYELAATATAEAIQP